MRIDTRLRERTSASRSRVGPLNSRVEFSGRQASSLPLPSRTMGASSSTLAGVKPFSSAARSEEHTSELQSRVDLVCRLLLEKKKKKNKHNKRTQRTTRHRSVRC